MKISKSHLILVTLFATALTLSSCGHKHDENHNHDSDKTENPVDLSSKEYASAYVCPMHCEGSGSDTEGKCPVCKMDYVKNPNNDAEHEHDNDEAHDDDSDHEGHSH